MELLALPDDELVRAVGGRRRSELETRRARFHSGAVRSVPGVAAVCRHDRRYPRGLCDASAPHMLHLAGAVDRLSELADGPSVAIVGTDRPSDYGLQMAGSLARGLGASGVTVVGLLGDGVASAAHAGALEVRAPSLAVLGGGVDVAFPARRRSLYEQVRAAGCAVAELPCGLTARRWALRAAERIVAGLARLTVVVEADDCARDLAAARIACALGRPVAAIPGRVTSPLSRGAHALLVEGASLVRGAQDVLELLCLDDAPRARSHAGANLPPRLRLALERVGAGLDTPDALATAGQGGRNTLLALAELELMGLLARGDGGRYVPREGL